MKKLIAIIFSILIFVPLFMSCEKTEQNSFGDNNFAPDNKIYQFTEKEIYDVICVDSEKACFSGVTFNRNKDYIPSSTIDENEEKYMPYQYNEKTVMAEYKGTYDDKLLNGVLLMYETRLNNKNIILNYSCNGDLIGYSFSGKTYEESENKKKSQEEILQIASNEMEKAINNPEEYTLVENIFYSTFVGDYHSIEWTRKNGKLSTMERIIVSLDPYGNIKSFDTVHIGDMKDIPTVPDAVVSKVIKSVLTDIRAKYDTVKDKFSILEIKDKEADICLVRMKDGTVALDVSIEVLIGKNGTDESATEGHRYVVPLE